MFLAKLMLMSMVLLVAYGLAVILMRRLSDTTRQLSELREQMTRNDKRMREQLERMQAAQEAQTSQSERARDNRQGDR